MARVPLDTHQFGSSSRSPCRGEGDAVEGAGQLAVVAAESAYNAHAVHPNYADRHEPGHKPMIGQGPVIKVNANQAYASDAETAGEFASLCRSVGVEPQHFVTRSDLGCGSTIGPISAARVGVRTVDVGNPMLSMHSCREMAGTADAVAVITMQDRERFSRVFQEFAEKEGLPLRFSRKATSKRGRRSQ